MKQRRWFGITILGLWAALVVASPAGAALIVHEDDMKLMEAQAASTDRLVE